MKREREYVRVGSQTVPYGGVGGGGGGGGGRREWESRPVKSNHGGSFAG